MRAIGQATVSALVLGAVFAGALGAVAGEPYAWRSAVHAESDRLDRRFVPPEGFVRVGVPEGSFAAWLRGLPLRPAGTSVHLHTRALKWRQDVHAAVVDIDTGSRDLQQCADAVMRLRAEWQFARGDTRRIAFNDTGGAKPMPFSRWAAGDRPRAEGRALVWSRKASPDPSYASFRRYMDTVFIWAGTHSLERELVPVRDGRVEIGDVIIKGGFPGHAVLVADVAEHPATGERRFLLIQSFMPAQDMHVLVGRETPDGSPWYRMNPDQPFVTPEWIFPPGSLRRWAEGTGSG